MEGTLLKWTNYYNGWQPRYFVLTETGVFSYYKSIDLIHEGCKGSCLVFACEVKVHPHDLLRFDLIIPGEQFFCLKAKSQVERQRWLVALGTCKSQGIKSTTSNVKNEDENSESSTIVPKENSIDHELKIKIQELRLYETVLMQRIHSIKSIANDTPIPDVKKLDETSSMLSVTCDAFIHTLDECVKLASGDFSQSLLLLSPLSATTLSERFSTNQQKHSQSELTNCSNSSITTETTSKTSTQNTHKTFFSQLSLTFAQLTCLLFEQIDVEIFLLTCEQYFVLIDKFNATTFAPLRADVDGNLNKLRRKFSNDRDKFRKLYAIINDEMNAKTAKEKNSATDALLWLKRSMDFIASFLYEFGQGDKTVADALNKAYGHTLKHYHGWITRGLFSILLRSVPYNEEFLLRLSSDPNNACGTLFQQQVYNEMIEHSKNIKIVMNKITEFFIKYELESHEIVG